MKSIGPKAILIGILAMAPILLGSSCVSQKNTVTNTAVTNTAVTNTIDAADAVDNKKLYTFTYKYSDEDYLKYCNGAQMDSEGYSKALTKDFTVSVDAGILGWRDETDKIKFIAWRSTGEGNGPCTDQINNNLRFKLVGDTVYISPVEGFAGVSIQMCACKPAMEKNLKLQPGIKNVVWTKNEAEWEAAGRKPISAAEIREIEKAVGPDWMNYQKKLITGFDLNNFIKGSAEKITPVDTKDQRGLDRNDLAISYSPDASKAVDNDIFARIFMENGKLTQFLDADHTAILYVFKAYDSYDQYYLGGGELSYGYSSDVFWIDNNRFIMVFGGEDISKEGYRILSLHVFDLKDYTKTIYDYKESVRYNEITKEEREEYNQYFFKRLNIDTSELPLAVKAAEPWLSFDKTLLQEPKDFSAGNFQLISVEPFKFELPGDGGFSPDYKDLLTVYSPDKTKLIDPNIYLAAYEKSKGEYRLDFDVDSVPLLHDLKLKQSTIIAPMCGTPCMYEDAFWIDNDRFVLIRTGLNDNERGDEHKGYYLSLIVVNLSKGTKRTYNYSTALFYKPASEVPNVINRTSYPKFKYPQYNFSF